MNPGSARLVLASELPRREIVHYADGKLLVASRHNEVFIKSPAGSRTIVMPESLPRRIVGTSRVARRALRLDKCNVVPVGADQSGYVIVRNGEVYHYDTETGRLTRTLQMENCRNVLHGAVTVLGEHEVVFGEYGSTGSIAPVSLHRSTDGGRTWRRVHTFPSGAVRHVHGCYWDPYEEAYWIFTGDANEEVQVLTGNRDLSFLKRVGGGSQEWRACSVFFEQEAIFWIMDSERENSHLIRFDRRTRRIEKGQLFPGPVWYTKRTTDGWYLAASTCEKGAGVHDDFAHLFASTNAETWFEIARFPWDRLPKGWFKFGVISFAEGEQPSTGFYISGEALRGLDGRSFLCRIEEQS